MSTQSDKSEKYIQTKTLAKRAYQQWAQVFSEFSHSALQTALTCQPV